MARTTVLSPRRYLRGGYGLALPEGFSLSTLRSTLVRAQALVDRYCNVPKQPNPFDWRGGTMTDEQHQWKIANPLAYGPGVKRVYLNAIPIKSVSAFEIDLGKTYRVTLDPATSLYLNTMENYIEVVAIAPTIVGVWPLGVALGLYNPVSKTTYDYGWSFPVEGDVLEAESPTVFSAAYGNWDATPAVVYLDGVEQSAGYAVDLADGTVTFDTAPDPRVEVSADYTYTVPDEIVEAVGFTATMLLARSRINQRGMAGLSSLRVAEVAMAQMTPAQMLQTRNGASIPTEAADLLASYSFGTAM